MANVYFYGMTSKKPRGFVENIAVGGCMAVNVFQYNALKHI